MKFLHLHILLLLISCNYTLAQSDWRQGHYYELKGSTEVTCSEQVEKVLEQRKSSYADEFFYLMQRGYYTCTERVWTKKEHSGIVYFWDEFREEWTSKEAHGEYWVFYWRFSKKKAY
jgi:hypothetical protein